MKNTDFFAKKLESAGLSLICKPTLNIIGFRSDNTKQLADRMRNLGWSISYIPRYDCIRVVVMPHVKRSHIVAFLQDLSEARRL
jgi:tyrosine decarboxylase/aspartate 1-decarboxylase